MSDLGDRDYFHSKLSSVFAKQAISGAGFAGLVVILTEHCCGQICVS